MPYGRKYTTRERPTTRRRTVSKAPRRMYKRRKAGLYRNITGNTLTVKCRVPITLKKGDFTTEIDDSLVFNILHLPWANIDATGANRLYNDDFVNALNLYQSYKLARVDYHLRRPDILVNASDPDRAADITRPTISMGTEVLHSRMWNQPDAASGVLQATVTLSPRLVTSSGGTNWQEMVDNQDKRFHIHGTQRSIKRTWLPGSQFERLLRDKQYSDQEHVCGGLSIRFKNDIIIPEVTAVVMQPTQVLVEGYADVFMNFSRRT